MPKYRVWEQGGAFFIQRKRWLLGWCFEYDMCIDGLRVPHSYGNKEAALGFCKRASDEGRVVE